MTDTNEEVTSLAERANAAARKVSEESPVATGPVVDEGAAVQSNDVENRKSP